MLQLATYSGSAVNCTLAPATISSQGVVSGAIFPPIQFGGISQTGLASITIRMSVDHASIQGGMDGAPVPSWTPGEWGEIDVEVWQTSTTQKQFTAAYNTILAQALLGNVSPTFGNTMVIIDTITQTVFTATGVAFPKIADHPYQDQAQRVHWVFKACQIFTEVA